MKDLKLALITLLAIASFGLASCGGEDPIDVPDVSIYDTTGSVITCFDSGLGTGSVTWTNEYTYLLEGFVFVNEGDELTIEPGTVIKGKTGTSEDASALIVARGATIQAVGTESNPIIMTAEADDLNGSVPVLSRGLWGGLIVLGKAELNSTPGETAIEGIPTTESRGIYGGTDDTDNSGTIKYISIRHGGTDIGEGNEINGLTLGGVGSGTEIDYVEIIANQDDGIEFFGGNPRVKHAVISFCGDDFIDYDEGYRGYGQFYLCVQDPAEGDRIGEHDGGTDPESGTPYAEPFMSNVTYIGRGASNGKKVITFRDNAGGHYHNSIFVNQAKGIDIEMLASGEYSYERMMNGTLDIKNNIFFDVADGTAENIFNIGFGSSASSNPDSATAHTTFSAKFATWGNTVTDPGLVYTGTTTANGLNPVPANDVSGADFSAYDSWFTTTTYKGAFDPSGSNWAKGWTLLDESGFMQ